MTIEEIITTIKHNTYKHRTKTTSSNSDSKMTS